MPKIGPVKKNEPVRRTIKPVKPSVKVRSLRAVAYPKADRTPHLKCDACGAMYQTINSYNIPESDVCGLMGCDGTLWPDWD